MKKQVVLDLIEEYETLEKRLGEPEVLQNPERAKEVAREFKRLQEPARRARRWIDLEKELENAREMVREERDPELREYLNEEIERIEGEIEVLEREIKSALLSTDQGGERNALVEIRSGTGGDEAALFAADLFKMYSRYAEKHKFGISVTDAHPTPLGGYKEITFIVEGRGAYGRLRLESGVHRVQRVPQTESGGRIHTSSASVVVVPEAEEAEIEIPQDEIRIETFRSSGPGGQHVNVTDSAVRIIHEPTGIVVQCQDERSQHKNKAKAMRVLRAQLMDHQEKERMKEAAERRRSVIGSGDRSEKIRTYNFPQRRVTDHRIGLDLYSLDAVLSGEMDDLIEPLHEAEERKRLEEIESQKGD
jgi:peptide chain release factor 1